MKSYYEVAGSLRYMMSDTFNNRDVNGATMMRNTHDSHERIKPVTHVYAAEMKPEQGDSQHILVLRVETGNQPAWLCAEVKNVPTSTSKAH